MSVKRPEATLDAASASKAIIGTGMAGTFQGNRVANALTEEKIAQVLDWAYDKAVGGVPGIDSAEELAKSYADPKLSKHEQANALIRWQNSKAAMSGFVTGLGGLMTLPVALPANIVSVLYVQVRMIAAIASIGGHSVRSDKVRSMVYACLVGNAAKDVLKDIGVAAGNKVGVAMVRKIPGSVFIAINKAVHFRLITKAGEKGLINATRAVPLLGGLVGGSFDLWATNKVGDIARDVFIGPVEGKRPAKKASAAKGAVPKKRPVARRAVAKQPVKPATKRVAKRVAKSAVATRERQATGSTPASGVRKRTGARPSS